MNYKINSAIALIFIAVYGFAFVFFISENEKNFNAKNEASISIIEIEEKNNADNGKNFSENQIRNCNNQCGNGECQDVVCNAINCPCAETKKSCSEDCF